MVLPAAGGLPECLFVGPGRATNVRFQPRRGNVQLSTLGLYNSDFIGATGTYQLTSNSALLIQGADQYGGADLSPYAAFGAQSGTTGDILLSTGANYNYFGFWWSAGDANNSITLRSTGAALATFSTGDILNFLSPGTITAVNGTVYNSSSYYGNPNNGQNTGEPYAFISIVLTGATFNQVVFSNNNTTGTGFESDNHTLYLGTVTPPGTAVFVKDIPTAPGVGTAEAPEPSFWGACAIVLSVLLYRRRSLSLAIKTARVDTLRGRL